LSNSRIRPFIAAFAALAFLTAPAMRAATADEAPGVSSDQLEGAAATDDGSSWLWYGRDLGASRFSPLQAVDKSSVSKLSLAWKKTLGPPVAMEGTPIVANGVMYVTTGNATVWAFDAATGAKKWVYKYPLPATALPRACCDTDNRGVTLSGNKVIFGTLDAHLVALDAATGKVAWNVTVAPNSRAYSITSPPLPIKNMVLTGEGGGEYTTRGFIAAYDVNTGKQIWRHFTIPGPGEPGYDTWKVKGVAARGGAPTWLPGTYDAKLDTVYWGTGNPNPDWDANSLKGTLLYSSSVLALSPETGKLKWFYQFTPHDIWDFDSVSEPILVDATVGGTTVPAIAHADRNGYLYVINRATGKLIYAVPLLDKITWGTVSRDGTVAFNQDIQNKANARKPYVVYPAVIGGKNWEPSAYDAQKHLIVIPLLESSIEIDPLQKSDMNPKPARFNGGAGFAKPVLAGSVVAIDVTTGKQVWKKHFRSPMLDGALITGSGLVFIGTPEGKLLALDEATGNTVWSTKTASGLNAAPMTYSIGGKQYISIVSGTGGVVSKFFAPAVPWLAGIPKGSMVYTWVLNAPSAMAPSSTMHSMQNMPMSSPAAMPAATSH
jgi:alcohol dehydrogenase (cytochrome c)